MVWISFFLYLSEAIGIVVSFPIQDSCCWVDPRVVLHTTVFVLYTGRWVLFKQSDCVVGSVANYTD